jgi:hypothetical protein
MTEVGKYPFYFQISAERRRDFDRMLWEELIAVVVEKYRETQVQKIASNNDELNYIRLRLDGAWKPETRQWRLAHHFP